MATEDRRTEEPDKERLYKTKVIQFLGRTTVIILQNDNGPCPLLAICNVLLLKNTLNLNLDTTEVSLQKLLALVAERLIDSNSCIQNKDAGYLENQQQNIADSIDLLPRLSTGIDVNIHFRRIGDFEFTRECAIFDLLDIPLYHGWIVDPQDYDTANAIGSKSYNTLVGELVALETRNTEEEHRSNSEEDCIDFAAATTATLGVPSPCLSRARSFDDSPCSISGDQKGRNRDLEEEAELLNSLKLSIAELPTSLDAPLSTNTSMNDVSICSDESSHHRSSGSGIPAEALEGHPGEEQQSHQPDLSIVHDSTASSSRNDNWLSLGSSSSKTDHSFSKISAENHLEQSSFEESGECFISSDTMENVRNDSLVHNQSEPLLFLDVDSSSAYKGHMHGSGGDPQFQHTCPLATSTSSILMREETQSDCGSTAFSNPSALNADSEISGGRKQHIDVAKGVTSIVDGTEPIYEGEDCIFDSGLPIYENREPMYEGEIVLSEQADRGTADACDMHPRDDITQQKGELIRSFLRNNASQLTIYGLFCLQEGLKERELCVFFRNNHFSTMFKFNGELFLLATDQGYLNQPDLVWEKLNEVNGDTMFMTGSFTEFKVENNVNDKWDEQNVMASTADYLATIDNSAPEGSTLNSDLQLAIALQQQEFENQPQRHQNLKQSSPGDNSRLVTGPQVPRSNAGNSSSKQDTKSKEKCVVM